jgi:hypothetical protein
VNVIVGSEIEEPFDGWSYTEILSRLAAKPRQDATTLARWIVKSYLLSYQGKGETVTQSALDVARIGDVVAKIDALSGDRFDRCIQPEHKMFQTVQVVFNGIPPTIREVA